MKYKPLFNPATYDQVSPVLYDESTTLSDLPDDFRDPIEFCDHPLILHDDIWKNTVINFDHLLHGERRSFPRVECYGSIVLYNKRGKVVAKGSMRDVNEKSVGFEIKAADLKINDVLYLEFIGENHLALAQVKVVLKRIQLAGPKLRIAVEYVDASPAFQDRLSKFLEEKRMDRPEFGELDIT